MNSDTNLIHLTGTLTNSFEFSHITHDRVFLRNRLSCKRLSGKIDIVPIILPEASIQLYHLDKDSRVSIIGEIRSKDEIDHSVSMFVYCHQIFVSDNDDYNDITFTGTICSPIYISNMFTGSQLAQFKVAINREHNKSAYINCIAWEGYATKVSKLSIRDRIQCCGRFQSRQYTKYSEQHETHEILITSFISIT